MANLRQRLIDLSVMVAIGLVLALIGPFGSFAAPFAWRLVYWVGIAVAGYCLYRPVAGMAAHWADRLDLPEPVMWITACLIATVPMTAVVWVVGHLRRGVPMPSLDQAVTQYGYVLVIGALVCALFYALGRRREARALETGSGAGEPQAEPKLFERLPPHLGRDLVALEMEDHYVRAHTRAGSDLILMRMRDAVAELDGVEGAQVHRSWWVARGAVADVKRDGRNVRLVLANGVEAPVARANVPELRAAGWL